MLLRDLKRNVVEKCTKMSNVYFKLHRFYKNISKM